MRFEWDEKKNRANLRKHGFPIEIAAEAFQDPLSVTTEDQLVAGEQRFRTTGCVGRFRVLVVVHTVRQQGEEEVIRIISARKATPREKRFYEEADE